MTKSYKQNINQLTGNYPTSYYISSGMGRSQFELVAFDNALLSAGVSNYNLVRVSSILPQNCKRLHVIDVKEGSPLLTAYATISSSDAGRIISTCIAAGIPLSNDKVGIIMEYSGYVEEDEARKICCEMVKESMRNHNIGIKKIVYSSCSEVVEQGWLSLISCIALW